MISLRLRRSQTTERLDSPVEYPVNSFCETEAGYFYLATSTKRYRFTTTRVLDSWAPHRIVKTTEAALSNYKIVAKMKFRNGSLIHNLATGKIYLISDNKRRLITNPDVLQRIGATGKDIITVSSEEIQLNELGEELN